MNLDRLFQAGVGVAIIGVVMAAWPEPGEAAYGPRNAHYRSAYHVGPQVLIDRGHWNRSAADPRFEGLYQLLAWDGYRVSRNRQEFVPDLLRGVRVLVVADPLGWRGIAQSIGLPLSGSAFSAEEVEAVHAWVNRGGSLLLIADRPPACEASRSLAAGFAVQLGNCSTSDSGREALGEDPIAEGRSDAPDQVTFVNSFGGGELTGPAGSIPFLSLRPGRLQGVAAPVGKGRVVVLTARLAREGNSDHSADNRQLMLNIMHWLSRRG